MPTMTDNPFPVLKNYRIRASGTVASRNNLFEHDFKDYNDGQDCHWLMKRKQKGVKGFEGTCPDAVF